MRASSIFLTALAAALVVTAASGSALASSQTWYLNNNGDLVANKAWNVPDDSPTSVNDGQANEWWANEVAAVDVPFGTGDFTWTLAFSVPCVGVWHVEIGYGDYGNPASFVSGGSSADQSGCSSSTPTTGTIHVTGFTVPNGKSLAFRIANTGDASGGTARTMMVKTQGDSFFVSPPTDPGYPLPELGTILLAGAGLGLVGLVALRRK